MATELKKVVKADCEDVYNILADKLQNLETDIETKVNEYREKLLNESNDTKTRLENMLAECFDFVEVEIEEESAETETAVTEENYIGE